MIGVTPAGWGQIQGGPAKLSFNDATYKQNTLAGRLDLNFL